MLEELTVLREVCSKLEREDIPYMVTGSTAMNYYAVPRMTRDVDIVIDIKEKDIDRIVFAFKDDFYIDRKMVKQALMYRKMFNLIHKDYIVKVDFIIKKENEFAKVSFSRKRKVKVNNLKSIDKNYIDCWISKLNLEKIYNKIKEV